MHYSAASNSFYPDGFRSEYERNGSWPADAVEVAEDDYRTYGQGQPPAGYQRGADENGRPTWVAIPLLPLAELATRKRGDLESGRKAAEKVGITYAGIRYAGDPGNRQALMEALDLADTTGQTTFASWKDSDGKFHSNHPVDDVRQALLAIATRRGELIGREGELNAQIDTALNAEDRTALEAIEWSEE